jgi:uncharacterized protein (TIGR03032 family)
MALAVVRGRPRVSYLALPHPSGVAVDLRWGIVHIASTRNPNQVYDFAPALAPGRPLVPVLTRFYPGGLYLHDLAMIGGTLHANAVGWNAVVRLGPDGSVLPVWWPRCVDRRGRPDMSCNHIQLNSIAAGATLRSSCFSASADVVLPVKPGDPAFPVDGRGVVFSGSTRRAIVRALTRPHSARWLGKRLWADNSGYGEVGLIAGGMFRPVVRLHGWTRGLAFKGGTGFAGTSRVLPRFRAYAPGVDCPTSECGVHAFDPRTGRVLGSLVWPAGNQVFAIEACPASLTTGFPFPASARAVRELFYGFNTRLMGGTRT